MSMRLGVVWIGVAAAVVVSLLVRPVGVIVAIVAFGAVGGVILGSRVGGGDVAFGILSFASRALPGERGDWGEAMLADLDRVSGWWSRVRFALGCARAALLLPHRPGAAAQAVRIVVATAAVAIIGLLFYSRSRLLGASYPGPGSQRGVLGIRVDLLFVGVVAASALAALVRLRSTRRRARVSRLYGAVGGVVVGGVALAGSLPGLAVPDVNGLQPNNWFLLAALAITLAVGVTAAWSSHDPRAGKEAGWWAGAIGGAILFIGLTTLSYTNTAWFTHDPASVHAFHTPQTHYKTIAALVLGSNLDTAAMIGILVLPLLGFILGALGGTANTIHNRTTNPAAGRRVPKPGAQAGDH